MDGLRLLANESETNVVRDGEEPNFARGTQELDPRLVREMVAVGVSEEQLAEIVHDLKAPLATIALEITMLDHRITNGETTETRPLLARLMQNVDFLDRLIQDLLDGWSPDLALEPRISTDLRSLLEKVIARSVPTRDIPRVHLEAPRTAWVEIDDLRIQRVVANLLSNALKYSFRNSTIEVRLDIDRDHCRVSVSDSGPGITDAEARFIFDRYRRTESARLHHGSGLGLYVCRTIIESHGGSMGVDSTPGVGSRFFFQLALP